MELAVKEKKENKALKRTVLRCEVSFEKAVPSRKEIRDAIISATGADASLLAIVSVKGNFGTRSAEVIAHLYADKKAFLLEKKHFLIRDGLATKAPKKAKAAAPKKK